LALRTLKGKLIAVTGACWVTRAELEKQFRARGARMTPDGYVNRQTDVLVRGRSDCWSHGAYGLKEERAAQLIRAGHRLVIVEDDEFRKLVELGRPARCSEHLAGQPIAWMAPPPDESAFRWATRFTGPLDRQCSTRGRVEQRFLRAHLFGANPTAACALCGARLLTELMVAGHIKPRSACTLKERRDVVNIAFPVCLLGCDALYERGLVSVDRKGRVVTANPAGLPGPVRQRLRSFRGRICPAWRGPTAGYFAWHFTKVFRH
jgi:hypothetical protein